MFIIQLLCAAILLVATSFCFLFWQKNKIETGVQIQCASGDSEVMTFSNNFLRGESQDSKDSKVSEAFRHIQNRRDENHEKYLAIKAKAIAENEAKVANGEELKLRSVTQEN